MRSSGGCIPQRVGTYLILVYTICLFTTNSASKPIFSYDPADIPFAPIYGPI